MFLKFTILTVIIYCLTLAYMFIIILSIQPTFEFPVYLQAQENYLI